MREPRSAGRSLAPFLGLLIAILTIAACAAPLVTITRPVDKEIISGTADIQVTYGADAASPIVRLELYIDGRLVDEFRLKQPALQGQQKFRWDFTLATPSLHTIGAKAVDASGAIGSTGIKVAVQRGAQPAPSAQGSDRTPPTVDIYFPQEGQVVHGDIQVKADASDNVGVKTVMFFLDGRFKSMIVNSPSFRTKIDTRKLTDGPHALTASAWDEADNEGQSEPRSFVVRNNEATTPETGVPRIASTIGPQPGPGPAVAAPATQQVTQREPLTQVASVAGLENAGDARSPATGPSGLEAGAKTAPPTGALPVRVVKLPPVSPQPSEPTFTAAPPSAASGVAGTEPAALAPNPRSSSPGRSGLPVTLPPPQSTRPVEPKVPPRADGVIASVPPRPEAAAAPGRSPEAPASSPLASTARSLPVPPRRMPVVTWAKLTSSEFVLATMPQGTESQPKTSSVNRERPVVIAAPQPTTTYVSGPVGSPRRNMVAALPPRKTESDPLGKTAQPRPLDVSSMAQFRDVKVLFNGQLLSLRTAPMVLQGVSIAPLREIFEHTDGVLYWFHIEKRVKAVNDTTTMELQIGDKTAKVNGADEELVLAPFIRNGRTMVPLEFIAQTLDVTVSFSPDTGELLISSNKF